MRHFLWTLTAVVSAAAVHAAPSLADVCTVDYGTCIWLLDIFSQLPRALGSSTLKTSIKNQY